MWDYHLGWKDYPEHKPDYQGWCATTDGGDICLNWWDGEVFKDREKLEVIAFMQVTSNDQNQRQERR